jgi:hypothetical protein
MFLDINSLYNRLQYSINGSIGVSTDFGGKINVNKIIYCNDNIFNDASVRDGI